MDQPLRSLIHTLVFAVLYLILFVMLIPPLVHILTRIEGKVIYGVFVVGAVAVALRLRYLARKFFT